MLQHRGVTRGQIVGLILGRSERFVQSVLAVVKAGATVLPIDPGLPKERIRYMLENSCPALLIAEDAELNQEFHAIGGFSFDAWLASAADQEVSNLNPGTTSDGLYVIYTSGSTGTPKGGAFGAAHHD
ncbi:AMP-binding protein [Paenibacillus hexagrammi]|uniref:AMP-binding protein n=1 Tax=Paenibacillus hexagrammi TaxID=2908839 RepID=UPI0021A3E2E9|nr:AMP-binding protein [Paenibacillus sp. YPD9-1]